MTDPRSAIPSVDRLLLQECFTRLVDGHGHDRVVQATRRVVAEVREAVGRGEGPDELRDPAYYAEAVGAWLVAENQPSLSPVINATGVVLHTNLGRAPLASEAVEAMVSAARGYTNLEYDLDEGRRGSRYDHCVSLLTELTGAEDALVVNNAAAALLLALNTLARGAGVAVSRGELVEIGGGFRIPEVLERSGARLVEVGSTNRTRLTDYEAVLDEGAVQAVLKVHRSNFRITGFTEEATVASLAPATQAAAIPLVYDLGSGLLADPAALDLPPEPRPMDALAQGADLVVFSGDKLLGGPQAGLILGRREMVARLRKNPMCRALRVDKTTLAALEATLRLYRHPERALASIPVLRMLAADKRFLQQRAQRLATRLEEQGVPSVVVEVSGAVGGGTYPGVELASWAVVPELEGSPDAVAERLRTGSPPVIGRIVEDRLALDVRTIAEGEEEEALLRRLVELRASTEAR